MSVKHLSIGVPASRTWCGDTRWDDSVVASAAKATCRPCIDEYIRRAWAPSRPAMCRPEYDHCDQQVAREGDLCPGHANASAQYACS